MAPCSSEQVSYFLGPLINIGKNGQASQCLPLVSSWSCPSRLQEVLHGKRDFLSCCPYMNTRPSSGRWQCGRGRFFGPFQALVGRVGQLHRSTLSMDAAFPRSVCRLSEAGSYGKLMLFITKGLRPIMRLMYSESRGSLSDLAMERPRQDGPESPSILS